ncbi:hypothetical protein SHKM778_18870 [Streptomyces sp. KM77-8]|uniref:Uncharacterized protein n=1 Tax=Streptomyces haneummycinicus TaxID=3074435 RepID=A0AAT9HDK4_9ACTN
MRALRLTHGVHIDSDPAWEADFHRLIEGFGALERLRIPAAGNSDPDPLTWGGLQYIARQYATRRGWEPALTSGLLGCLLDDALTGVDLFDAAGPAAPAAPPAVQRRQRTDPAGQTVRSGTEPRTPPRTSSRRVTRSRTVSGSRIRCPPPACPHSPRPSPSPNCATRASRSPRNGGGGGTRRRRPGQCPAPPDLIRLLMSRPAPWPAALDTALAATARHLWHTAFTDFEPTAPNAAQAWDTALALVLPGDRDAVLTDWRYTGEAYRAAVRRLAGLLAAPDTDPGPSNCWPPGSGQACRFGEVG